MKTDKNSRTLDQGLSAQNDEPAVSDINTRAAQKVPALDYIRRPANTLPRQIRNCRQLRQVIAQGVTDFRLMLAGGVFSSKIITLGNDCRFKVENWIDDSIQMLTGHQLYTHSNIGRAMQQGAFVIGGLYHE